MTNETTLKRGLQADSDTDDDDLQLNESGSPEQNCRKSDRKRRRGIVEKRRRDRINQSLGELRRLVPAAFEKQGSAKLEKAEILQMAVDHLKVLHAKGVNGYSMDTAALAMDYRSVGFRECAAEVARYLVSVEGMDIQDPLRLRLMSHLQCYSAQRDVASKASLQTFQHNPWNMSATAHNVTAAFNSQYNGNSFTAAFGSQSSAGPPNASGLPTPGSYPEPGRPVVHTQPQMAPTSSSLHTSSQVAAQALSGLSQMHAQLPVTSLPSLSPTSAHYNSLGQSGNTKPYRPWGAELAY